METVKTGNLNYSVSLISGSGKAAQCSLPLWVLYFSCRGPGVDAEKGFLIVVRIGLPISLKNIPTENLTEKNFSYIYLLQTTGSQTLKTRPMDTKAFCQPGKEVPRWFVITILAMALFSSCTVTNNLYVNNPFPLEKNTYEAYAGLGLGLEPKVDSVSAIGEVFSNDFTTSYSLVVGGRYGFAENFSVGGSLHLPQILGGIGLNLRPQYSLLSQETGFNLAIAADIGGVFSKDSITELGLDIELDPEVRGSFNTDFSIPVGARLSENLWVMVTPRYSFSWFYFREQFEGSDSKTVAAKYPALSLGLRAKKIHFELTGTRLKSKYRIFGGIVYFFD